MGWSIGWDSNWNRDIGYGVPALCDHPKCNARINRGLAYVCCDQQPHGAPHGCGLYFCYEHVDVLRHRCARCVKGKQAYKHPKPDVKEWIEWKLTDESWQRYRDENPEEVAAWRAALPTAPVHGELVE
jgi:hypothetical protein